MSWLSKIWAGLKTRLLNVAINEDRAVASSFGAPVDWTISGETGKHAAAGDPVARVGDKVLDATLPGGAHGKHSENAAYDDAAQQQALDRAESGK